MADEVALTPMTGEAGVEAPGLPLNTKLALDRTRLAHERTLMAWIRTATSLITFGFTVYKFFQIENAGKEFQHLFIGTRQFAMLLIGVGLLALLLGTFEHRRDLKALSASYPAMPRSGTGAISILMAVLGVLAFIAVLFRG